MKAFLSRQLQTFLILLRIRSLRRLPMTRDYFSGMIISCTFVLVLACGQKPKEAPPHFTKADSLMDTYLALQDSMLQTWNIMINDDNQKIESMHALLHELMVSGEGNHADLKSYEERLNRLKNLRYTRKSMANPDVITEYDFASGALVTELLSLAESQRQFAYNPTLQKLADNIRTADERALRYRESYDRVAAQYNNFLKRNRIFLVENDPDSLNEKPLFQVVSDD